MTFPGVVIATIVATLAALYPSAPAAAAKNCVAAEEARVHAAGDSGGDDEETPKFTAAFYRRVVTLDASLDGADGAELPISIEDVCDVDGNPVPTFRTGRIDITD